MDTNCKNRRIMVRIVFASDLPKCDCGEPWCPVHFEHFADCACVGPTNAEDDGYELAEKDGTLYGVKSAPNSA